MRPLFKNYFSHRHRERKRFILFVFTSWLIGRLWLGLEFSRLALLRTMPAAQIQQIAKTEMVLPPSRWIHQDKQLVCLGVIKKNNGLVARELPKICNN